MIVFLPSVGGPRQAQQTTIMGVRYGERIEVDILPDLGFITARTASEEEESSST